MSGLKLSNIAATAISPTSYNDKQRQFTPNSGQKSSEIRALNYIDDNSIEQETNEKSECLSPRNPNDINDEQTLSQREAVDDLENEGLSDELEDGGLDELILMDEAEQEARENHMTCNDDAEMIKE